MGIISVRSTRHTMLKLTTKSTISDWLSSQFSRRYVAVSLTRLKTELGSASYENSCSKLSSSVSKTLSNSDTAEIKPVNTLQNSNIVCELINV